VDQVASLGTGCDQVADACFAGPVDAIDIASRGEGCPPAVSPWCGRRLPLSQRDRWFDEIRAPGVDPWSDDDAIPPEFDSAAWRLCARE
jgi:hypothetical protein